MRKNNKISLREVDLRKFSTIDTNKTQIIGSGSFNLTNSKPKKSKEMLRMIYSNEKVSFSQKNKESR